MVCPILAVEHCISISRLEGVVQRLVSCRGGGWMPVMEQQNDAFQLKDCCTKMILEEEYL